MGPVNEVSVRTKREETGPSAGKARLRDAPPGPPRVPGVLADTGLSPSMLGDLLIKVLGRRRSPTGAGLTEALRLSFALLDDQLIELQRRGLVAVGSAPGHGRKDYVYELTAEGRELHQSLSRSDPYAGPAPVLLEEYVERVHAQSNLEARIDRARLTHHLEELVLDPELVERLGPAINAGGPILLHGASGDGKTAVAEVVARLFDEAVYIPRAVLAGGSVITLFDPSVHQESAKLTGDEGDQPWLRPVDGHDPRYVRIVRPAVRVAGELTLAELDLQHDSVGGSLHAPPQMKANGGVLIIDDVGHQQISPRELLARWAAPLERGIDYLGLALGARVPIPFDCRLVLCTDRPPAEVLEDTFLRRVSYRIRIDSPDREAWTEIFRRECRKKGLAWRPEAASEVFDELYRSDGLQPRAWHPSGIVEHLVELARFREVEPELSEELLGPATLSTLQGLGSAAGRSST